MVKRTKREGAAAAAFISASVGCFVIGVATVLSVSFSPVSTFLNWWGPAGPLTGKTGVGVIIWLLLWLILHFVLRDRKMHLKGVVISSFVLVALAFVALFPPFFELFH